MISLQKILVATDFSDPSNAALGYGRELARTFGATLTVVHVVDDLMSRNYGIDGGMVLSDPALQRQLEADARRQVDNAVRREPFALLNASGLVLVSNSPSTAIVQCAHQCGSDLIVMGTHGRSGFAHLLMGSVAERVVQTAPCPVLTVRNPQPEFVVPDAVGVSAANTCGVHGTPPLPA
jgi:nucleotide-binding universal stress UspA family protein